MPFKFNPFTNNLDEVTVSTGTGILTITANVGGSVGADAFNNINLIGSPPLTFTGNPVTNTITVTSASLLHYTPLVHASSPYVVQPTDVYMGADTTLGVITIRLPNAPTAGTVFYIKDVKGTSNVSAITVTTVGGVVKIDAAATYTINVPYEAISLIFAGGAYQIF